MQTNWRGLAKGNCDVSTLAIRREREREGVGATCAHRGGATLECTERERERERERDDDDDDDDDYFI